jgi:ATP-dependent Clp protease, protease subunit
MIAPQSDAPFSDRLLSSRIVMLGQEVNDEIANRLCSQLLFLESEDPAADIWLYINSPGGSVTAGMAIYDTMQFIECDVATVAMGFAASMGQFLLCAGAPGKRFILPNARVLMHQPSAGLQGAASDIAIQAEAFSHTKVVLAERIAAHIGRTVDQIRADWDRDRWFTAEQSLAYGFVDHILAHRRQLQRESSAERSSGSGSNAT